MLVEEFSQDILSDTVSYSTTTGASAALGGPFRLNTVVIGDSFWSLIGILVRHLTVGSHGAVGLPLHHLLVVPHMQ